MQQCEMSCNCRCWWLRLAKIRKSKEPGEMEKHVVRKPVHYAATKEDVERILNHIKQNTESPLVIIGTWAKLYRDYESQCKQENAKPMGYKCYQ